MGTRVLIVEDDADIRENLLDILQIHGYQAAAATTASDALERVDQSVYDLIVIDWHLPDTTAGELLPRLRHRAPEASVLIATGSSDIQHAIRAMQHGASDYIVKPICPELLLGSIQRAIQLQSAQRRAIQSERLAAIGTAVAAVAHESRNALHRIRTSVDVIRLVHEDNAELLEDLAVIENASAQLQLHFEELRDFSAPIVLNKVQCGLQDLVRRVWNHVQSGAARGDAQLSVPDQDVQCMMDPVRIEQVIRNLFENAIAASESEAHIEVDWSTRDFEEEESLCITVRDQGNGFTEQQRASAFEPFFTTKRHGTGLGLPICRRIVEAHGGAIFIKEGDTVGSEITIVLPGMIRSAEFKPEVCSVPSA